jgi:hypothetical protein
VAVRAFNRGLIDQFIPKQTPDISRRLIEAVEHLMGTPHARHAQIWRATLKPEQNALLRSPQVARELSHFVDKRWAEYVVLGHPFGVLGMDSAGHVGWLQLETREGLKAAAELAVLEGVDATGLEDIRNGHRLTNLELRQALGGKMPVELAAAFHLGEGLLGALFTVDAAYGPDPANSYSNWLARQEKRHVQG